MSDLDLVNGVEPPSEGPPTEPWRPTTWLGRSLLSVLLVGFVATVVIWNLPSSEVRDDLRAELRPHVNGLHLNQSWALFSPNPSRTSIEVIAEVTFADGTVEVYRFPGGDPLVGAYREYRWRKYERRLRLDANTYLWEPAARWIADRYDGDVVEVALIRRFSTTPTPGTDAARVWEEFEFHRSTLSESET